MTTDVSILGESTTGSATLVPVDVGLTSSAPTLMAQRFLIELMTDLDSALALPGRGTGLPAALRRRIFATEYDALLALAAATNLAAESVRAGETSDDDPSGRLASALVQRLTVLPGAMIVTMVLRARSGGSTVLTFPVSVNY